MKAHRLPLLLVGVGVLVLVVAQWFAPRPLDWRPSFEADATSPYGARVLYDMLPALLGGAEVASETRPPYLVLGETSSEPSTYLFVTEDYAPDDGEAERLYRFAERGNTVFIAASDLYGLLADTLGVEVDWEMGDLDTFLRADSLLALTNPALARPGGYRFDDDLAYGYFASLDTARTTVLGTMRDSLVNYVRVDVGEGAFYLSAVPLAFTNYNLLGGDGADYVAAALSYLPTQPTVWDAYTKPLRNVGSTPLRYVLEHPALKWAYVLGLVGTLLFILFRGRRWQRAIPPHAPPPNRALAFARTLGGLYHHHGDDRDLVEKKARYFLDRLRTRINEPTLDFAESHRDRVARKAGVPRADVDRLFDLYLHLRAARPAAADLLDLDRRTDAFFHRIH